MTRPIQPYVCPAPHDPATSPHTGSLRKISTILLQGIILGMSRISRYEAAELPNATVPIPGDGGHYVVELDVFHQLRRPHPQTIYSNYYPEARISLGDNEEYAIHCIDSIRQSLMCSSDVSLLILQWDEATQQSRIRNDVVHQCRDFDDVKGWALYRQLKGTFNTGVWAH
ncbi:hypothetical protein BDN71DRAFT_1593352 [Pleurotus eryngii]|uniref:Uncharacterized protein n=1 Tax=Pleurotus eryngii TaxID=5323 RepID=A0A9P5ZKS1_PLEER|nr:hypothetical protein BDN71DRAFT_1593352 [Pleurotus eryngii]